METISFYGKFWNELIKMKKKRILSGLQPSGKLHIGNYFGMMKRMIKYQDENDLFCFIANYHALTTKPDKIQLRSNTFNAVCDFLALGIDPEKSTFWIQSDLPQVTELSWILSSFTTVSMMDRSTSYKDKVAQGINANMGLYSYPILMASDILLYDSEIVPVGKDQKQHLEIARDIASKFNRYFGEVLKLPKPEIEPSNQLIPGIDGQKMSKSYNNIIPIFDDAKNIKNQIMKIKTDTADINSPKNKNSTLFKIYSLFLNSKEQIELASRYDNPGLRYGDIKKELFERIMEYFYPYRLRRDNFQSNPSKVKEILANGASKASAIANRVMERVRKSIGINYNL